MTPRVTCLLIISVLTCEIQAANYFKPDFAVEVTKAVESALISIKEDKTNEEVSEEVADKLIQLVHRKGYTRRRTDIVAKALEILQLTYSPAQLNSIEYHETMYATFRNQGICFKRNFFGCTVEKRSPYRALDGSCNNLEHPEWGMSFRPQSRFLDPEYDDGVSSPRNRTVDGMGTLPNPRTVSNVVHANTGSGMSVERIASLHAFQWGQFLDHDLISTPLFTGKNDAPLQCCRKHKNAELQQMRCIPIYVPNGDGFFKDGTCMNVQRSSPALSTDCNNLPGPREQENQLTSYVDASQVYGSSMADLIQLRNKQSPEYLAVSEGNNLPFNDDNSECILKEKGERCSLAGDVRVNTVPSLASYHTLFVQEHNRIVDLLKRQGWTDPEELFQEARKINIAEIQHVTYNEFLRWLLSQDTFTRHALHPTSQGQFFTMYDSRVKTDIANDFGIAYRMGHSWITNRMRLETERGDNLNSRDPDFKSIEDTYFNPHMLYMRGRTGAHRMLKSMTKERCPLTDRIIEDSARTSYSWRTEKAST